MLDCGNSGTTLRLAAGILAGLAATHVLDGDDSLRRRPVARIIEPLRSMGAVLHARRNDSLPPLTVVGRTRLRAIDVTTVVPSAQVKSAILLAGLRADGRTTVREAIATRDHTERMLRARGVAVAFEADRGRAGGGLECRGRWTRASRRRTGPGGCLRGRVLAGGRGDPPGRRADAPRRRGQPDPAGDHRPPPADGRPDRRARSRPWTGRGAGRRRRRAAGRPRRPVERPRGRSTSRRPRWPPRSTRSRSSAWPRPRPAAGPRSAGSASCGTRNPIGSPGSPRV